MALRIKRIKSGTFTSSIDDVTTSKTLVDQQLGFERSSGNLKINDDGEIKNAIGGTKLTSSNRTFYARKGTNQGSTTAGAADFRAIEAADLPSSITSNTTGSSASCTGNAATATKLATARTISLTGAVTGSASFDGSSNATISTTSSISSTPSAATKVVGFTSDCDYVLTAGQANAQTIINNAIAALPSTGGKVILREGTYNIAATITMNKANVTLEGMGDSTVLNRTADSFRIIVISVSGCVVRNLLINGNKSTYTGLANYGIESTTECLIESITSSYNYVYGIYSAGGGRFLNNKCSYNGTGLGVTSTSVVSGNICTDNLQAGIVASNSDSYLIIVGNYCANNGSVPALSGGIMLVSGTGIIVTGNYCHSNTRGINCSASVNNITIQGNYVTNSANYGIHLNGSRNIVSGNIVNDNNSTGIFIINNTGTQYNAIVGNQLSGNTAAISDGGIGTLIRANKNDATNIEA